MTPVYFAFWRSHNSERGLLKRMPSGGRDKFMKYAMTED